MWAYVCHNMHTQVTGQLLGTGSLLPEFHSLNRSNKVASPKTKTIEAFSMVWMEQLSSRAVGKTNERLRTGGMGRPRKGDGEKSYSE